jgi:hypothetical protein
METGLLIFNTMGASQCAKMVILALTIVELVRSVPGPGAVNHPIKTPGPFVGVGREPINGYLSHCAYNVADTPAV